MLIIHLIEKCSAVRGEKNLFRHKNMIVRIIFMLLVFGSLFKADDTFAQTGKVSASQKSIVKGETGAKMDELLTRYAMYGFSGTVLIIKNNQIVINKAYGLADIGKAANLIP
jgi:CubicO group peptidase (beta-lactamase class C family)